MASEANEKNVDKESNWIAKSALVVAVVSFIFSGYLSYDRIFLTDIEVYAGRQARLYATARPQSKPVVFLSLTFVNDGGRLGTVTNTRLLATINCNDKPGKTEVLFESLREVDNILTTEGELTQESIAIVTILGKATESKKYVYVAPDDFVWDTSCNGFEMVLDVQLEQDCEWLKAKTYRISTNSGVWCDLYNSGKFKSEVVVVSQMDCQ